MSIIEEFIIPKIAPSTKSRYIRQELLSCELDGPIFHAPLAASQPRSLILCAALPCQERGLAVSGKVFQVRLQLEMLNARLLR